MDQHIHWIVAVIGAGTLIGVFWKMRGGFGPINLRIVGIVLIAVLATLLALARSTDINAAMGILGTIAGYLFGAREKSSEETRADSSVDASGATFGDAAKVAGRDINETIEKMQGDVKEIKDSVINQVLESGLGKDTVTEFLFFTSFFGGDARRLAGEPINESAKAIRQLQENDWSLFSTTTSYTGGNGLVLIFRRTRRPDESDVKISADKFMTRIYHGLDEVEMDYL